MSTKHESSALVTSWTVSRTAEQVTQPSLALTILVGKWNVPEHPKVHNSSRHALRKRPTLRLALTPVQKVKPRRGIFPLITPDDK